MICENIPYLIQKYAICASLGVDCSFVSDLAQILYDFLMKDKLWVYRLCYRIHELKYDYKSELHCKRCDVCLCKYLCINNVFLNNVKMTLRYFPEEIDTLLHLKPYIEGYERLFNKKTLLEIKRYTGQLFISHDISRKINTNSRYNSPVIDFYEGKFIETGNKTFFRLFLNPSYLTSRYYYNRDVDFPNEKLTGQSR